MGGALPSHGGRCPGELQRRPAEFLQELGLSGRRTGCRASAATGRRRHQSHARRLCTEALPSEEALALYLTRHLRLFEGSRVLVAGAGLGLASATCTEATHVELTCGDE